MCLCHPYDLSGKYSKIVDIAPEVIDLIEKAKRESDFFHIGTRPYPVLCGFCGWSMGHLGAFDEGRTFLEKGLHHAAELNDIVALAAIEGQYGYYYYFKGDWKSAKNHFEKGVKYGEDSNFVFLSAIWLGGLGVVCAMLGDTVTGKRHAEKGLKIQRDNGLNFYRSMVLWTLGLIHRDLGDLTNARNFAEDALRDCRKIHFDKPNHLSIFKIFKI